MNIFNKYTLIQQCNCNCVYRYLTMFSFQPNYIPSHRQFFSVYFLNFMFAKGVQRVNKLKNGYILKLPFMFSIMVIRIIYCFSIVNLLQHFQL